MKTLINEYNYQNGAYVKIFYQEDEPNVPFEDCLIFELKPCDSDVISFGLRPDEALLIITLMSQALNKVIKDYDVEFDNTAYNLSPADC